MNEGIEEEEEITCGEDLAYALTLKWSIFWKLKQILKKISTWKGLRSVLNYTCTWTYQIQINRILVNIMFSTNLEILQEF